MEIKSFCLSIAFILMAISRGIRFILKREVISDVF